MGDRLYSTKVNFMKIDIPMKIPIAMFSEEVGDVRGCFLDVYTAKCTGAHAPRAVYASRGPQFSLIKLVNKFAAFTTPKGENGVMAILNALLRQQRIIFLGYNLPSGEVRRLPPFCTNALEPISRVHETVRGCANGRAAGRKLCPGGGLHAQPAAAWIHIALVPLHQPVQHRHCSAIVRSVPCPARREHAKKRPTSDGPAPRLTVCPCPCAHRQPRVHCRRHKPALRGHGKVVGRAVQRRNGDHQVCQPPSGTDGHGTTRRRRHGIHR